MQALIVRGGQLSYRADHPAPAANADEALIKVSLAGICATDLEIVKGYSGFQGVLGHEFVGVVGNGPPSWVGRRVVGTINIGCGRCAICLGQGAEHCPNRTVLGIHNHPGAFADYLTLPARNLLEVPASLSDEQAVFTEPLAAALRIREQLIIPPTSRIAVIGPGRLGLLVGMVLNMAGTDVVMIGRRESSLELPRKIGLNAVLPAELEDNSFDFVVEVTGNRGGLIEALRLTRPLGTIVMKSTYAELSDIDLTKVVVDELTVVGSRCGPFAPALRLLASGQIDTTPLLEAEFPLREGPAAMRRAAEPGVRKILLRP